MFYFLFALFIVAALLLLFTYFVFEFVFGPRKERDPREVPNNEQYQVFKDETVTMVTALMEKPFEKVEIISHDSLEVGGIKEKKTSLQRFFSMDTGEALIETSVVAAPFFLKRIGMFSWLMKDPME